MPNKTNTFEGRTQQSMDARAAAFNSQHRAYNPITTTNKFEGRSQQSMDARAAAFNSQHRAYNPTTIVKEN